MRFPIVRALDGRLYSSGVSLRVIWSIDLS